MVVIENFSNEKRIIFFDLGISYDIVFLIGPMSLFGIYQRYFHPKSFSKRFWTLVFITLIISPVITLPAVYWTADAIFENAGYHRCTDHNLLHYKGAPLPTPIDPRVWVLDKAICKVP